MLLAHLLPSPSRTSVAARAHPIVSSSSHYFLYLRTDLPLVCFSSLDAFKHGGEVEHGDSQSILVERYGDGKAKRYVLDNNLRFRTIWEDDGSLMNRPRKDDFSDLSFLPKIFKDFILPAGFPASVSDDYLDYMLLQLPTNVTGWICHTLVTSSLLQAVGVGSFSRTGIAASAAAIQWVSKDGLGAIGRLFIGGRFGSLFDDDPKQWRMYADIIGSAGSIFELSTQLYPEYFLPLASLGNLTKAVARGLKDPSFRVIQNHFSISANLGEVAAKEEVWEVAAQLVGLALGILIMGVPGIQESYSIHTFTWLGIRLLHLWLRYQSLSVLQFRTINLKRARILVRAHVLYDTIPRYADANKEEELFAWWNFLKPRISFGVSMETMLSEDDFNYTVKALLELYAQEKYILYVNQRGPEAVNYYVTFKVGATNLAVLKSLWHVYWLHAHHQDHDTSDILGWLRKSLLKLENGFAAFLSQLEDAGWSNHQIILKVPNNPLFEEAESAL